MRSGRHQMWARLWKMQAPISHATAVKVAEGVWHRFHQAWQMKADYQKKSVAHCTKGWKGGSCDLIECFDTYICAPCIPICPVCIIFLGGVSTIARAYPNIFLQALIAVFSRVGRPFSAPRSRLAVLLGGFRRPHPGGTADEFRLVQKRQWLRKGWCHRFFLLWTCHIGNIFDITWPSLSLKIVPREQYVWEGLKPQTTDFHAEFPDCLSSGHDLSAQILTLRCLDELTKQKVL